MASAGATVKGGYYLNRDAWDLIAIAGKEGVLPGEPGQRYVKLPVWSVLALAPLAGGLFVVFLPLIGFALVALWAGRAVVARGPRWLGRWSERGRSGKDRDAEPGQDGEPGAE